ncbi:MAG: ROK family protein [Chthoniobacterales bacterium]
MKRNALVAAIEAGGTKFICAVGTGPDDLRMVSRIPTTTPDETLRGVLSFFDKAAKVHGPFAAIGVASFGPLDLVKDSATYGYITSTPKPGWQNVDLLGPLRERFGVPVGFDTDVNGAALGEHLWGAGQGCDPLVYLTIGTGIGGGALVNGKLLHGMLHPEMGHLLVPQPVSSAPHSSGVCPFHSSCLEGFISGPAIARRWGSPADTFAADHEVWKEFATVLASGLVNIIVTFSPQRIILGGGVMHQAHLLPMLHAEVRRLLNRYLPTRELLGDMTDYIVPPGLGEDAGIIGAIALGVRAMLSEGEKN